jgi:TatD DNase family protein
MLVDTHCHLTFKHFDSDRENVIEAARKRGVLIVNSSVSPEEAEAACELSKRHSNVYWTLGLTARNLEEEKADETERLVRKHRGDIIGLGEVGLDYYWVKGEEEHAILRRYFRRFIELSIELNLPLVVHSRDAEEDCLKMLNDYRKPALLHCFSGNIEQAKEASSFGCLISVPANITYARNRQKLVDALPLESLVLESDAPYLPPQPGTRNEPLNVVKACEKISELKKGVFEEVEAKTSANAKRFFNI